MGQQYAQSETIKSEDELDFAVFCIENIAAKLGKSAPEVYAALTEKSDILRSYVIPEYAALHTQGKEYIVNDIVDVMAERGVGI